MKKQLLFVIIIALSANCVTGSQILNGSFEQADSNDPNRPLLWQIDPNGVPPQIRQSFSTNEQPYPSHVNVTIEPFDGQYFVLLRSDSRDHTPQGQTDFCLLSQKITVWAGQYITGAYFFSTGDYMPFNDAATIKLIPDPCDNPDNLTEIRLAYKDVNSVGSYQTMLGWNTFTHDFNDAEAGTYTLILQIEDCMDALFTSRLAVDALKIECIYALAGDINSDCTVDFYDFELLAKQWLNICESPTWCNNCDINQSSMVDFADFATMAGNWLIDCYAEPGNPACVPK